jgi:hypothetical protein
MSLDITKLVQPAIDWTGQTWAQRVDAAASLLFVHGYIPPSQRVKVTQKLDAQFRKGLADGLITARATEAHSREEG